MKLSVVFNYDSFQARCAVGEPCLLYGDLYDYLEKEREDDFQAQYFA